MRGLKLKTASQVNLSVVVVAVIVSFTACEQPAGVEPPTDTAPSFTGSVTDRTYAVGEAIEPLTLPAATGGNGVLSYTLVPAVPGLTFTPSTRTLTGTPTTAGSYRMTYRVADADENNAASDGDSRTFAITVQAPDPPDTAPRFAGSVADRTYAVGEAIEPLVLPAATGGNGALSYTLVPAVPGLTFTPSTHTLTGTPTTVGSYRMTYRVADADENNAASDGDSRTFTIIVQALAPLEGVSITYRGYGDEVFQLNPAGDLLDNTVNLLLGDARPEVYLIATNPNSFSALVRVERVGPGIAPTVRGPLPGEVHPSLSKQSDSAVRSPHWVSEFNNYSPAPRAATQQSSSGLSRAQRTVEVGERFIFRSSDEFENVIEIPATSRKVVTDGTTTLIVWVADDEWGACSECVRQIMVDTFADRFLRLGPSNDIHDWLTALFGSPWGPHDYALLIPAEDADDIHILVYDIDADGPYVEGGPPRVGGYFWAKDNLLQDPNVPGTSNERLMFYMDAPLLAQREGASWDATDYWPSFMISALAHEFQHMIHYYQKRVKHDFRTVSETWLDEMSSEVAEDLVAEKLKVNGPRGVAYDDSTAGVPENWRGRLPWYNYYNYIQVTAWDYSDTLKHYSISYALGAYLARTYGAGLFRHIVQNDRSGVEAIEAALRSQGHGTSFGDVLVNWAAANLLSDNTRAPAPYRYNSGTWTISRSSGETYRLGSINLFNYRYHYGEQDDDYLDGPILYRFEQFSDGVRQRPHSNAYTSLGRATGTVRLNVDARAGSRVTVVIKE